MSLVSKEEDPSDGLYRGLGGHLALLPCPEGPMVAPLGENSRRKCLSIGLKNAHQCPFLAFLPYSVGHGRTLPQEVSEMP